MKTSYSASSIISHLGLAVLTLLAFLTPLLFSPLNTEFFFFPKQYFIVSASLILLLLWGIKSIADRKVSVTSNPFTLPLLILTALYLISAWLSPTNYWLILIGRLSLWLSLISCFIFGLPFIKTEKHTSLLISSLILSVTLSALIAIYQYLGIGAQLTSLPWLQSKAFSPLGNPINVIIVTLTLIPLAILTALSQKTPTTKILLFFATAIMTLGAVVSFSLIMPGGQFRPALPPFTTSWEVALESIKSQPLTGVGPSEYQNAYSAFKGASINTSEVWDIRFGNARNEWLFSLTILGLSGLATMVFLAYRILKLGFSQLSFSRKSLAHSTTPVISSLLVLLLLLFFVPANTITLFLWIFLLLIWTGLMYVGQHPQVRSSSLTVATTSGSQAKSTQSLLPYILLFPIIIIFLGGFYLTGRVMAADMKIKTSFDTMNSGDGIAAYTQQIEALAINPYSDQYRSLYSQTNLALANALSQNENPTEQDQNQITQLIQQAIREARLASQLNPQNPTHWENLAQLYRQLIGVAEGADQFANASYAQAVALDPTNPRLRVSYGGLYFSLEQHDLAIQQFTISTQLKPDYGNAWFNLSAAYEAAQQPIPAYQAMQQVLSLVPADSPDFQTVQTKLAVLEALLPTPTPEPQGQPGTQFVQPTPTPQLTIPSPLPTPVDDPIELPPEEQPPLPEGNSIDQVDDGQGAEEPVPTDEQPQP